MVGAGDRHGAVAASRMRRSAPAMMSRTWCATSGLTEIDVGAELHQLLGVLGSIRRRLAAERGADAGLLAGANDASDGVEDGRVGFIEQFRAHLRIPITPSTSWVRSLLPMETPSMPISAYVGIQ